MVHRLEWIECGIWAYVLGKLFISCPRIPKVSCRSTCIVNPPSLTLPMLPRLQLLHPASRQRRARKHKNLQATVRISQPRPPASSAFSKCLHQMLPQRIEYIAWQQASVQYAVLRKMTQPFGSNLPGMLSSFAAVQAMRTDSRARFVYIEKKTTHACSVYTVYSHTIYTRTHTYIHPSMQAGRHV